MNKSINNNLLVSFFGGLGGLINALWSYLAFIKDDILQWHILIAGLFHGALIAFFVFFYQQLFIRKKIILKYMNALPFSWIAGYISYFPLALSISPSNFLSDVYLTFSLEYLYWPLQSFGLVVGVFAILALIFDKKLVTHRIILIPVGIVSGILGSLWFWLSINKSFWHFSVFHGSIWGILTGLGLLLVYPKLENQSKEFN